MENWKSIKGYEGLYEISDLGRIKSYKRKNVIILVQENNARYDLIYLCKGKTKKRFLIHRLVAEAFIPNNENKLEVNHIDGKRKNNCAYNLEWCTRSENAIHSYANGLQKVVFGDESHYHKLTEKQVLEIRSIGKTMYQKDIAKMYNVDASNISNILSRKIWTSI